CTVPEEVLTEDPLLSEPRVQGNKDRISRLQTGSGLVGRQSAKSLGCIRKSIKKNLHLMQENMRIEFEKYLILSGEVINSI
ncbi:MAG: hypothetical protein WAM26_13395, partial [Nitrososphaeraceae archaeon]